MGYLAVFVSDVENVASEGEFVNVGAKFEGEMKEQRRWRRSRLVYPSRRARLRCRDAARGLGMVILIHQRLPSEVDTL